MTQHLKHPKLIPMTRFRKVLSLILAIILMLFIFEMSSRPALQSTDDSIHVGMLVCHIFVPGFDEMSSEMQYELASSIDHPVRKMAHATEYALLCILVFGAIYNSSYKKCSLSSILFCLLYAITDECHQLFVPGRSGQISDVVLDTLGATFSMVLLMLFIHIYKYVSTHIVNILHHKA